MIPKIVNIISGTLPFHISLCRVGVCVVDTIRMSFQIVLQNKSLLTASYSSIKFLEESGYINHQI